MYFNLEFLSKQDNHQEWHFASDKGPLWKYTWQPKHWILPANLWNQFTSNHFSHHNQITDLCQGE